jgi:hypothetical protein
MTKFAGRGLTVEVFGQAVGQLLEFGEFGSSRAQIDGTAYGDDWADYVTGIQDGSEVPFRVAYDPAETGHILIRDTYETGDGRMTFTAEHVEAGTSFEISTIITALNHSSALDGLFEMAGTLKIVEPGVVETS